MHQFLEHDALPNPLAVAHRGYSAKLPENTMAAFAAAVELGYRCIETDVHLTSDDVLVAFHDSKLDRVTNSHGSINSFTWDEINKIRVKNRESIPQLLDLMTSWPDIRIIIDPKEDSAVEPLYKAVLDNNAWHRVCVGSFSDRRLDWLRDKAGSRLCTSMGPNEVLRMRLASFGMPIGSFRANCIQAPLKHRGFPVISRRFVNAAHKLGYPVQAWTINAEVTMNWLLDIGIDAIMTDEAILLKNVMQNRKCW